MRKRTDHERFGAEAQLIRAEAQAMQEAANETMARLQSASSAARVSQKIGLTFSAGSRIMKDHPQRNEGKLAQRDAHLSKTLAQRKVVEV